MDVYFRNLWKGFVVCAIGIILFASYTILTTAYYDLPYETFFFRNATCLLTYFIGVLIFLVYSIIKIRSLHVKWHFTNQLQLMKIPVWEEMVASIASLFVFFVGFAIIETIVFSLGYFYYSNQALPSVDINVSSLYFTFLKGVYTRIFLPLTLHDFVFFTLMITFVSSITSYIGRGFHYMCKAWVMLLLYIVGFLYLSALIYVMLFYLTDIEHLQKLSDVITYILVHKWYYVYFVLCSFLLPIVHVRLAKKKRL